jgi:hypothetical protein
MQRNLLPLPPSTRCLLHTCPRRFLPPPTSSIGCARNCRSEPGRGCTWSLTFFFPSLRAPRQRCRAVASRIWTCGAPDTDALSEGSTATGWDTAASATSGRGVSVGGSSRGRVWVVGLHVHEGGTGRGRLESAGGAAGVGAQRNWASGGVVDFHESQRKGRPRRRIALLVLSPYAHASSLSRCLLAMGLRIPACYPLRASLLSSSSHVCYNAIELRVPFRRGRTPSGSVARGEGGHADVARGAYSGRTGLSDSSRARVGRSRESNGCHHGERL